MNNKTISYVVFALLALIGIGAAVTLALALGAGSLFVITSSSGQQPTPVESYDPAPAGYQPIIVDQVEVEVGVGSPIPVHVMVSGKMPDPCSQVEYTEIKQDGSNFIITLSATPDKGGPAVDGCIKDPMIFTMGIPLNVVDLPAGSYAVTVNGSRADFKLDTADSTSSLGTTDMPIVKSDIQVDSVNVDIGRGSPLPIHAIVSANLPNACAQLGEVRVQRDGTTFFVRLVAYLPAQTDCNPDTLPIRIEVPLNIAYAPEGPYEVNVNGVTASFDHRTMPAAPVITEPYQLTYIGSDGNVWYLPSPNGEPQQITADANENLDYYFPQISSDGEWIAYRRDVGTTVASAMEYTFQLVVHNVNTNQSQTVVDHQPANFAWKPGTRLLAYSLAVPEGYFTLHGEKPNASLASPVLGFDADTGATTELVKPERGYALYSLQWSPDGRYLSFDEMVYMEGRGLFGYYDFETGTYTAWGEPIGNYVWDLAGSQIIYDRLTYTATGTEDIFARKLKEKEEQHVTGYTAENEYAFLPTLSPIHARIAYLASLEGPDSQTYALLIQNLDDGQVTSFGTYEAVNYLSWSPDGQSLLFSAGPWDTQQVLAVNVTDGSITVLGSGTMPHVADHVK